jgi:Zn-dependent protease with chaperone function
VFHLPAILLALAMAGWAESHPSPGQASAWSCLAALLVLAALAALPHLLARPLLGRGSRLAAACWRHLVWSLALLGQALLLFALDWPACLRELGLPPGTLLSWPRPAGLLLLLPYLLLALVSIDASARWSLPPGPSRRTLRRFHARQLLVGAGALLLAVSLCWPLWWHRPLRVWVEESAGASALFTLCLAVAFAGLFPVLLRFGLGLKPLPQGPLRSAFEELVQRAGFQPVALRVWPTGGWLANAAIVGFLPRLRLVLLTDGLLMGLRRPELLAVLAHELGHARRHHVLLYTLFSLGWLGLWPGLAHLAQRLGWPLSGPLEIALLAGLVLSWLLLFGVLSRRAELDADLSALELIGSSAPLEAALEGVSGPGVRRKRSWRHFTAAQRIIFLRGAAADPGVGQRLRQGLRGWKLFSLTLVLLAGCLGLLAWRSVAPTERVWIALRLGRFAQAQALLELMPSERRDSNLMEWALLGQNAQAAGHLEQPARLLQAAREAFAAGAAELALRRAELGLLLDWSALEPAEAALAELVASLRAGVPSTGPQVDPGPSQAAEGPLAPAGTAPPAGGASAAPPAPGTVWEWPPTMAAPRPVAVATGVE